LFDSRAHVLIAGVSTRAAAESAARADFRVTAIDAFGDLDQHPSVTSRALPRRFSGRAAVQAARGVECDAVAYLSSFENHPKAVAALAAGRTLWGNPPDVLRRVRDPLLLAQALRQRGFTVPGVASSEPSNPGNLEPCDSATRWLLKPLASGGGRRVRPWRARARVPPGYYLQELVEGMPGSVVFVAAGGRAVPLGISQQLIGDAAFGATGYQYCGSILAPAGDAYPDRREAAPFDDACALSRAAAAEFGLVGVNGIDFIARNGRAYAVEVNPRWSASMELVELAYGLSVFGAHAAACARGELPDFTLATARQSGPAVGKAVVFARRDVVVGDTRAWLPAPSAVAQTRDVPHAGERILAGRPVCTAIATGRDRVACHAALVRVAEQVYGQLAAWESEAS
jgi:predicted ATP-grasp superfamily ATP-dependent carboligase